MKVNDSIDMYLRCVLLLQLASSQFFRINAVKSGIDSCLLYDFGELEKYAEGLNFPEATETPILEDETIVDDLPFGRLPTDWKRLSRLGDVLPMDVELNEKFVVAYKILIIAHQRSLMKRGSEEFVPIADVDIVTRDFDTIGRGETTSTGIWGSEESGFTEKQKSIQKHEETWHTTRFEDQLDAVSPNATSPVASNPIESIESNRESGQNLLFTNIVSKVSSIVDTTTGLSDVEWAYNQPSTSTAKKYTKTPSVSSPYSLENTINSVDPETRSSHLEFFTSTRTSIVSPVEDVKSSSIDDLRVSTAEQQSLSITEDTRRESATMNPHYIYNQTSSTQQSSSTSTKFSAISSSSFTNTDFHEEYEEVTADGVSGRVGKSTDNFWTTGRGEMLFPKEVSSKVTKRMMATPSETVVHEFSLPNHVTPESRKGFGETEKTKFGKNFENSGSEMLSRNDEASTLMSREGYTTNFEAFHEASGPSNQLATFESTTSGVVTDALGSLKPSGETTMTSDTPETSQRKEGHESVITSGTARDIIGSGGTTSRKLYTSSFESFTTTGDAEEDPVHEDNASTSRFINANGSLPRLSTVVIKDKSEITSQGIGEHGVGGESSETSTQSMENGRFEVTTPLAMDESRDAARSDNTSSFVTSSQTVFKDSSTSSVEDQSTSLQQQTVDLSLAVSARSYHNDVDDGRNTPTTEQTEVVEDTTNVSSYPLTNDFIATADTDSSIVGLQATTTILDPLGPTIHTPWTVDAGTSSPASKIVTTPSSIHSTKLDTYTESREVFNGLTTFSKPHLTNTVSEVTAEKNDTLWTTAAWKILMESTTELPFVVTTSSSTSNSNDVTSDETWIQRTSFSGQSEKLDSSPYLENSPENISTNRHSTISSTTIDINSSAESDSTDFQIASELPPAIWKTPKMTSVTEFFTAYRSSHPTPSSLDPNMRNPVENIPDKKIVTFNINEDVGVQTEVLEPHPAMEIGSDSGHSTASTPVIGHVLKIHSRNKWNSFGDEGISSIRKTSKIPQKTGANVFEYENWNRPIFVPLHVDPKSKTNFRLDSNRLPSDWSLQKRAKPNMDVEKLYRWFYRHNEDLGDSHPRGSSTRSKTADIRCKN